MIFFAISICVFFMGSNCGYDFFMVLGAIGKSLMFLFMVLDVIFSWLWIRFLMDLDICLRFFYGFGMVLAKIVPKS